MLFFKMRLHLLELVESHIAPVFRAWIDVGTWMTGPHVIGLLGWVCKGLFASLS
jgi:hypothetical protein